MRQADWHSYSDVVDFSVDTILENDLYWMYLCLRKSVSEAQVDDDILKRIKSDYPLAHATISAYCEGRMNEWELSVEEINLHEEGLQRGFDQRYAYCDRLVLERQPGSLKRIEEALESVKRACGIYDAATGVWQARESALASKLTAEQEELRGDVSFRRDTLVAMVDSLKSSIRR